MPLALGTTRSHPEKPRLGLKYLLGTLTRLGESPKLIPARLSPLREVPVHWTRLGSPEPRALRFPSGYDLLFR
jgi:hypothetical protein